MATGKGKDADKLLEAKKMAPNYAIMLLLASRSFVFAENDKKSPV